VSEHPEGTTVQPVEQAFIEDVVARVVARVAPDKPSRVSRDQSLVADLGFDSLLLMEMRFGLEELFELQVLADEDPAPLTAVWEVQGYVVQKVLSGEALAPTPDAVEAFLEQG
jgi:acyl carrier protein